MCRRNCILSVIIGLILGVASALLWYFGYVLYAREMLPFALAFGIILFFTTAILRFASEDPDGHHCVHRCIRRISPLVTITAAIFIIVALVVLATYLSLTLRIILALVGSISFWIMLIGFITMILTRPCRD